MLGKIDFTRSGLTEKTSTESDQIRDRVKTNFSLINKIKEDFLEEIKQVKENLVTTTDNLANKIDLTQSDLSELSQKINQVKENVAVISSNFSSSDSGQSSQSSQSSLLQSGLFQSKRRKSKEGGATLPVNLIQNDLEETKQNIAKVRKKIFLLSDILSLICF